MTGLYEVVIHRPAGEPLFRFRKGPGRPLRVYRQILSPSMPARNELLTKAARFGADSYRLFRADLRPEVPTLDRSLPLIPLLLLISARLQLIIA